MEGDQVSKDPQISEERKALYYGGAVVMGLGFLLFISTFFLVGSGFGPGGPSMGGMAARGIGGMVLMLAGAVMRNVGARGTAGSGLVLDPEKAREDLKPWARTAGGLIQDALTEVRSGDPDGPAEPAAAQTVVKVRCTQCRTLNDVDARFCKGCGAGL